MVENSNEEYIENAEHFINSIKTDKEYKEENGWHGYYNKEIVELARILEHILQDYKRVLKENEEQKAEIERRKHDNKTLKEFVSAVFNEDLNDKYIIQEYTTEDEQIEREGIENEQYYDTYESDLPF